MILKFLVNSIRSEETKTLSLSVSKNGIETYKYDPCPEGILEMEFKLTENSIINFSIKNKLGKYTVVKNGKNIKDTALIVQKITIDNNDVFDKINLFSNYYIKEKNTIRTNGYMGFDGTYQFKFRYPSSRHLLLCKYY